ncbi:hypothetical protein [Paraglaciecola aestuariivivens]
MKYLVAIVLLVSAFCTYAEEEVPAKPLDPAYEGVHGMVLFNQGSRLYASHMPTYNKPHNAQIVYRIETKHAPLLFLVRDAEQVSLKPESFNLERLIRGEEVTVKAEAYLGHFERGGTLFYEDIEVTFSEQKYLRMLEELSEPGIEKHYDVVELDKGARLLIHQIQQPPSFDHIALLFNANSCITTIRTGKLVPDESTLISNLSFCGSMKRIYFETKNFAKNVR